MPIGDIQLTTAAMQASPAKTGGSMATNEPRTRADVVIGEKPTDTGVPEDLANSALPRDQVEQFLREIKHQPNWRREADRAADYYDGNQLSSETVEKLKERGQPPLVTNLIKPTVDTVLGMEAKTRSDWRVRPEDDDHCPDELAEGLSVRPSDGGHDGDPAQTLPGSKPAAAHCRPPS